MGRGASVSAEELESTYDEAVEEGHQRLTRSWGRLLATGAVGGIDVGIGVFALLFVQHQTGSTLLAGLAFGIGFIALTLANSELFTEDFLVPIAALVGGRASGIQLVRLWVFTLVANMAGGWVLMALVIAGAPELRETALEVGTRYVDLGITARALALAIIGGVAITLLTWMERRTSDGVQLVPAVAIAFLLTAGELNHSIVGSLEMFAALVAGAPFGYLDWLSVLAWATLGNLIGGVGLVTILRLVQVGKRKLDDERRESGRD